MFIARMIKEETFISKATYIATSHIPHHILIGVRPVMWVFDRLIGAALDIQEGGNIYKDRDFTQTISHTWPPSNQSLYQKSQSLNLLHFSRSLFQDKVQTRPL